MKVRELSWLRFIVTFMTGVCWWSAEGAIVVTKFQQVEFIHNPSFV